LIRESYVRVAPGKPYAPQVEAGGLERTWGELSEPAKAEIQLLFGTLDPPSLELLTEDGVLEIVPGLGGLLGEVARVMPGGSFLNIDYGEWFPGLPEAGQRWGLESRRARRCTVRGYFKRQMVLDPLARPGRQDLTADVDFAALDLHGRRQGFETVLFTTLARFLRAGGAERELRALAAGGARLDPLEADRQATVIDHLLDEQDLGGAFKLMLQVRE
jgi:SAM-dependent MidA family methyltransferase